MVVHSIAVLASSPSHGEVGQEDHVRPNVEGSLSNIVKPSLKKIKWRAGKNGSVGKEPPKQG